MLRAMNENWLDDVLAALRCGGYAVVEGVLDSDFRERTRHALYCVREKINAELGMGRLERHGELGTLRIPMKFDDHFFSFLELPELLAVIDATVGDTAILNRQTGIILPSFAPGEAPSAPQNRLHMEFTRVLNGYLMAINALFAIDDFTAESGGTLLVPGSNQADPPPSRDYLERNAISIECPAGSMLIFDSTLWHCSGENVSGRDRLAVGHMFVRSYVKQQFDYCRALGEDKVQAQKPRTQQLLGWYTRVVTSLDEYYRPPEERLYRDGQG
jgi:ectoine hydroxylase-related dioxygenase (phytanoyl-CoA dioxygenase family)